MTLLSIHISNFKSYNCETTIPLKQFSAIIGPNGSGKSNIMDAISFLFAIHSSFLRSNSLKHLINQHNQNAPATVSATYKSANGEIILFKRTINQNGSSTYFINDASVSHAEYIDALKKENILVNARNFLVFQGDVEAIAAQSPKDLTRLIEQISGSIDLKPEYDRLKSELDAATEQAAAIFNKKKAVSANLKLIKDQQVDAEKFDLLASQKSTILKTRALWRLYHIDQRINALKEAIQNDRKALETASDSHTEFKSSLATSNKTLATAQKRLIRIEKSIKDQQRAAQDLQPEMLRISEQIKHCKKKQTTAEKNKVDAESELEQQSVLVNELEKDLRNVQRAMDRFEKETKDAQTSAPSSSGSSANDQEEYRRLRDQADKETFTDRQSLVPLQAQLQTATQANDRLQERLQDVSSRISLLTKERQSLTSQQSNLAAEITQTETTIAETRSTNTNIQTNLLRINQTEHETQTKLSQITSQLLQVKVDQHESDRHRKFQDTITTLQRLFPGIHGTLSSLVQPTQNKYHTSVSVILGKNMNAVVVDTQKVAIQCIKYMRDQRCGHATFLPLDSIVVKPISEKYRSYMHGVRLALDVIQITDSASRVPNLDRAVQYACGNAIICDTLDIAKHVCYDKHQDVKAVTLDGTVIHKAGMITGGTTTDASSAPRQWTDTDVQRLKTSHEALVSQLQDLQSQRRKLQHDDQHASRLSTLTQQLTRLRDTHDAITPRVESIAHQLRDLESQRTTMTSTDQSTITETLTTIRDQVDALKQRISSHESRIFHDFCRKHGYASITDYESRFIHYTDTVSTKRLEFTTHMTKLRAKLDFENTRLRDMESRINHLRSTIETGHRDMNALETQIKTLESTFSEHQSTITSLQSDKTSMTTEIQTMTETVSRIRSDMAMVTRTMHDMSSRILQHDMNMVQCCTEKCMLVRQCRLDDMDIRVKIVENGSRASVRFVSLREVSLEDIDKVSQMVTQASRESGVRDGDDDEMDVDQTAVAAVADALVVDYAGLDRKYRENGPANSETDIDHDLAMQMNQIDMDMARLLPTLRSDNSSETNAVSDDLMRIATEYESVRTRVRELKQQFDRIKNARVSKFSSALTHISGVIDSVYKHLTVSSSMPTGGTAYITHDSSVLATTDDPFSATNNPIQIKYHAMPPMKRFRDMHTLSGGEKTVASLALLFAIQSYRAAPFYVMDEIDASLDTNNVIRVVKYLVDHSHNRRSGDAHRTTQFIVISLKSGVYENADGVVGVYRDVGQVGVSGSRILTLDLEEYDREEERVAR